jgi:hypothetical protein
MNPLLNRRAGWLDEIRFTSHSVTYFASDGTSSSLFRLQSEKQQSLKQC